jgi:uncharacterized protein (TIGR03437 family)
VRQVRYIILLLGVFSCPGFAQFSGLSATGDGRTVYFSSSLRLRGATGNFDAKLFRISGEGLTLFWEQERGRSLGWYNEYFYDLTAAQVSTDGSIIAFTGVRGCGGGSGCLAVQTRQGTLADSSGKVLLSAFGSVNISPNAQYALFFGRNTFGSPGPASELISVASGAGTAVPHSIDANARRRVANDGTVALFAQGAVLLWQASGEQTLTGVSIASPAAGGDPLLLIGADGRRLVYQTPTGLASYDRSTASEQVIATVVAQSVSIDENATLVAYIHPSDSQIYIAPGSRQLTREPEGIAEVALSGDGRAAFAVTRHGRMLRVDVASGAVSELVARTPHITNPGLPGIQTYIDDGVSPGSLIPLSGVGLSSVSQSAVPPLPRTLGEVTVRIAGVPAAIQSVSPELVWIQAPWELSEQQDATFEFLSGDSPFETGPGTINIRTRVPHSFATTDTSRGYSIYYTAVHENWSGLVTQTSPARPGEIITVYFNGLGPVTPPVGTGEASPADPPARVTGPFRCQFWDGGPNDSHLYFAGLAPGMVGVYQVSLEIPAGLRTSPVALDCDFGPGGVPGATGSIFVKNQL